MLVPTRYTIIGPLKMHLLASLTEKIDVYASCIRHITVNSIDISSGNMSPFGKSLAISWTNQIYALNNV
jgi:hypothetical protein